MNVKIEVPRRKKKSFLHKKRETWAPEKWQIHPKIHQKRTTKKAYKKWISGGLKKDNYGHNTRTEISVKNSVSTLQTTTYKVLHHAVRAIPSLFCNQIQSSLFQVSWDVTHHQGSSITTIIN